MAAESQTLFQFVLRELSREDLEALVAAHREEYITSFHELVSPEMPDAQASLYAFEREVLKSA